MAWDSQIDTPGDHVECRGSRLLSNECASDMLPPVHRDLAGGLECPGRTRCRCGGVGDRGWPLALTVSRAGLSWVEGGHRSVGISSDFLSE